MVNTEVKLQSGAETGARAQETSATELIVADDPVLVAESMVGTDRFSGPYGRQRIFRRRRLTASPYRDRHCSRRGTLFLYPFTGCPGSTPAHGETPIPRGALVALRVLSPWNHRADIPGDGTFVSGGAVSCRATGTATRCRSALRQPSAPGRLHGWVYPPVGAFWWTPIQPRLHPDRHHDRGISPQRFNPLLMHAQSA